MNKSIKSYGHRYYITIFIVITGLLLPCKVGAQNKDKSSLPTILSFSTKHRTSDEGNGRKINWIDFSWQVENATKVRLYRNGIEIKSRSQRPDGEFSWPLVMRRAFSGQYKKSAIYELVAENNVGKTSKKLRINKKKKRTPPISIQPKILDFRVEPQNVKSGEQVSFYWQVKNVYQVRLYDSFGEIKSRIKLPKGNYGWPLSMNASYMENLNKSETYKLVVTGKNGTVSRSVKVLVSGKKCKLIVSITGIYSKYTDAIGVYKVIPNNANKFLFKRGVNVLRNQGKISYKSTIYLPFGNYYLVPSGGGKDKYGYFGVMYKPRKIDFTCRDGNTKHIIVKADTAEY